MNHAINLKIEKTFQYIIPNHNRFTVLKIIMIIGPQRSIISLAAAQEDQFA